MNGRVAASKPLSHRGRMMEGFWLEFRDGRVVDYGAESGLDSLKSLLEFDEGSSYLGEVALVPFDSAVNNTGVLFLNTLFDENASCHLALGDSYPENLRGGEKMERGELTRRHANHSLEHCDFMFGTADLCVTGTTKTGEKVPVLVNGAFVL